MNYVEYGKENKQIIMLLHGGGLSWWNYREAAELLAGKYHVILPILDGHANSNTDFTTIEDNATRIIQFIDKHFDGSVLLIGGLSLGGQILLEILSQRHNICRYALIESALAVPSKITYAMIKPAFGSCYNFIHQKWFSKLQFQSLRIKEELFEDYFRDTSSISKSNMIAFLQANAVYSLKTSLANFTGKAYIFVGELEKNVMRTSAKLIHENLKGSSLETMPHMYHGEFSLNHPDIYAAKIQNIIHGDSNL